jgi:hypothetical protein
MLRKNGRKTVTYPAIRHSDNTVHDLLALNSKGSTFRFPYLACIIYKTTQFYPLLKRSYKNSLFLLLLLLQANYFKFFPMV